jgi:hypothetical protein
MVLSEYSAIESQYPSLRKNTKHKEGFYLLGYNAV